MSVALAALISLLSSSAELNHAERAFAAGRFEEVLPEVASLLASDLKPEERRRALELQALTYAAFGAAAPAVDAFRRLLQADPRYQPPPHSSPKVSELLATARRQLLPPAAVPALPVPPPGPSGPPLWRRGWFWAAVGVALAGGGAVTFVATRPGLPQGSLPTGTLQ